MTKSSREKCYRDLSVRTHQRWRKEIRADVAASARKLGGLFHTIDPLGAGITFADAVFIGKTGIIYNCTFETTRGTYIEKVWRAARKAADERYKLKRTTRRDPVTGGKLHYWEADVPRAEFEGMTRADWIEREQRRLADSKTITIFEEVELDESYYFGVGLHATLDVKNLSRGSINRFIRKFLKNEAGFKTPEPFSYSFSELDWPWPRTR